MLIDICMLCWDEAENSCDITWLKELLSFKIMTLLYTRRQSVSAYEKNYDRVDASVRNEAWMHGGLEEMFLFPKKHGSLAKTICSYGLACSG